VTSGRQRTDSVTVMEEVSTQTTLKRPEKTKSADLSITSTCVSSIYCWSSHSAALIVNYCIGMITLPIAVSFSPLPSARQHPSYDIVWRLRGFIWYFRLEFVYMTYFACIEGSYKSSSCCLSVLPTCIQFTLVYLLLGKI